MELSKKEYKFKNGLEAVQAEATYKTDKKLLKILFKSFDVNTLADLKTKFNVAQLIEKLLDEDLLLQALCSVLTKADKGELQPSEIEDLTREEIITVVEDFFILSPRLSKQLGIGRLTQDSQQDS